MKHLIEATDPSAESFTIALTRAYSAELEDLGHEQQTYDLYRMGFNPVLNPEDSSPLAPDGSAKLDVQILQDDICSADVLTLIYPLWRMSMPAMMKGFVERVFVRGFAYDSRDGPRVWPACRTEMPSDHRLGSATAAARE
ncbi:MAG: NAD(P)H-dependent oxidoreductase [Steroidobacteraceae bacterium]|jgi:NAD(P)H dehydrogenase (quinone)